MAKAIVWAVTVVGFLPSILLTIAAVDAIRMERQALSDSGREKADFLEFMHSIHLRSLSLSFYPRIWPLVLIVAGLLLVLIGLFAILHLRAD